MWTTLDETEHRERRHVERVIPITLDCRGQVVEFAADSGGHIYRIAAGPRDGTTRGSRRPRCVVAFGAHPVGAPLNLRAGPCVELGVIRGTRDERVDKTQLQPVFIDQTCRYSPRDALAWTNREHGGDEYGVTADGDLRQQQHLSFSAGKHYCWAAGLVRIKATLIVEEFLRRIPDFEPGSFTPCEQGGEVGNRLILLPLRWGAR
jgi:hypothetical protein